MSPERRRFEVPDAMAGERLDRAVATEIDRSRSEVRRLIDGGAVRCNGRSDVAPSTRLAVGDVVEMDVPPPAVTAPQPDASIVVPIVFEDDDVIVVDKPAGLVVHPGSGRHGGTMVNGLLAHDPELAGVGEAHRPGIVHRLDAGTTGLLVVARTPAAHAALSDALARRDVRRVYRVVVGGTPEAPEGVVDAPIGRSPRDPTLRAVVADGRPARTHYEVLERFPEPDVALLECRLETGRTHQIRVHLAAIGHAVIGDVRYGGRRRPGVHRPLLHAAELAFVHPTSGEEVRFRAPDPADLTEVLADLR